MLTSLTDQLGNDKLAGDKLQLGSVFTQALAQVPSTATQHKHISC